MVRAKAILEKVVGVYYSSIGEWKRKFMVVRF
jgi:hypothetical protein